MYRNYMQARTCCSCNCSSKSNSCNNNKDKDIIDDTCECVQNMMDNSDSCECGFDEDNLFPSNPMYAQSYVPWQTMDKTFTPCVGLKMGTIFPELVSPYMPGQSMEEIEYIRRTNKIGEGCNKYGM